MRSMSSDVGSRFSSRALRTINTAAESRTDWVQPVVMLLLSIVGVLFIHSAQAYVDGRLWLRQIIWIVLGFAVYAVIANINYQRLYPVVHLLYAGSLLLLLLIWTPLGVERYDARRWLDLQLMLYQPSEAAKIGLLLVLAGYLARKRLGPVRRSLGPLVVVALLSAPPLGLIFLQPDLGSALVLPPMVLSLLYAARLSSRFFALVFGVLALAVLVLAWDVWRYEHFLRDQGLTAGAQPGVFEEHSWVPLRDYQRNRLLAFTAPEVADPQGTGITWNMRQSSIAVGTGGLTGKGWGEGTQAQLGYLPRSVAHNDFIFSVLAEETGFLGGLAVIGLYAVLIGSTLRVAGRAQDSFGLYLALGVSVILVVHIAINIAMTIGFMPITGLPLPFLSYGGSFFLSCCIMQGLVQSIYRHRRAYL